MQPVGPYRFTEALGVCQVGMAWWAIDGQDRLVTVAMLDGAAAADQPWREAFANAANAMALTAGGQRYANADFAAPKPWVAYPSQEGMGAQRLFQTLGMELHPAESAAEILIPASGTVTEPPKPVSGAPTSGTATPTSGAPLPWAVHAAVVPQQVPSPTAVASAPPSPEASQPVGAPPQDQSAAQGGRRIQPSEPTTRRTGLGAAVVVLLLVAVVGGGMGLQARSSGEPGEPVVAATAFPTEAPLALGLRPWALGSLRGPEERALAVAGPSMVFVEVITTGYVRNKPDNGLLYPEPVTVSRRCTGVVINPDGHVLTNSNCVQLSAATLLESALDALADALVAQGTLKAAEASAYPKARAATSVFTGSEPGSQPEIKVYGQLNVAERGLTGSPAIPGTIVGALSRAEGNLALVKLDQADLPAAELNASAAIAPETSLLIIGYATDTTSGPRKYTVSSKSVRVTEVDSESPVNAYRVNDDIGSYSRGGIAIDPQGRVVGVLDRDPARSDLAVRLVVPVSAATGLLSAAAAENSLAPSDRLYRRALDAYFAGDEPLAASRLGDVLEQSPSNLLARAYRDAALSSVGTRSSRPGWAVPLLVASGVALMAGLAMLVGMVARRRTS